MLQEKQTQTIEKIDKITKIVMAIVCCCLGAIFLAACTYMIQMISTQENSQGNINEIETK